MVTWTQEGSIASIMRTRGAAASCGEAAGPGAAEGVGEGAGGGGEGGAGLTGFAELSGGGGMGDAGSTGAGSGAGASSVGGGGGAACRCFGMMKASTRYSRKTPTTESAAQRGKGRRSGCFL